MSDRLKPTLHRLDNRRGWSLDLKQWRDPATHDPARRPIVMFPGYAMNTFILTWHPQGLSMVEYLVRHGHEVWTANLRGQGDSRRTSPLRRRYGLKQLALEDVPRVIEFVERESAAHAERVDAVGCSLGASYLYAYLAHHRERGRIERLVAIGGPLRWVETHPLMRLVFSSPSLVSWVPIRGTRTLARVALPVVKRVPPLLSLYMNAAEIDLSRADQLVQTVDDPVPWINRQVAHWMRHRDLVVDGVNVTEGLRGLDLSVLCVLANADGIVPPASALAIRDVLGQERVDVLEVGTEERWYAHADLFVGNRAQDEVFEHIRGWLGRP